MRDRQGPGAGPPGTSTGLRGGTKAQVLKAARACFLEYGVRKTTMEKVAASAGVSRSIVYRLFLDRRELIEAASAERISEIADEIADNIPRDVAWDARTLVETFTDVSLAVIENVRSDHELGILLADDSPVSLHHVVWMSDVAHRGTQFWRPWLEHLQALGILRKDVPLDYLIEWLQTVYPAIILREHMAIEDERRVIERFILASLAMVSDPKDARWLAPWLE
jgi:AcrR family transcriptional regulator